jgi:hypothetical protein
MEFAHRFSINKENNPGPEVPRSNRVLEIEKVIGFLNLFSIIWLLEGKIWKSIKAFVAAGWLFLEKRRYGQRAVLLTKPMNMSVFENEVEFTRFARTIFADLSKFQFRPAIQKTVDEMAKDANSLFSFYTLNNRRNDVAGTTGHKNQRPVL